MLQLDALWWAKVDIAISSGLGMEIGDLLLRWVMGKILGNHRNIIFSIWVWPIDNNTRVNGDLFLKRAQRGDQWEGECNQRWLRSCPHKPLHVLQRNHHDLGQ